MQHLLSSEKRTLDHWATVQLFFSLAQVRCFWRCFCFRSGLVALFLKMSDRGDSWALTPASVHSLWSSPKCLNRLCLTVFSSLRSSLLLVHIFQPNFFLPVNFTFNMLWYSTPWTAIPFGNDSLWLSLFVEGVNDRLLDHCQVSSVPHYCGFKEQEISRIYTVWMVIYWNSNETFSPYYIFFRCTCTYSAAWSFVNPLECSISLHKYGPKHHQIFIEVLKVDKENRIKQVREKYFLY